MLLSLLEDKTSVMQWLVALIIHPIITDLISIAEQWLQYEYLWLTILKILILALLWSQVQDDKL